MGFTQVDRKQPDTGYVYVFVRRDLSPSIQAVQACHACIESARKFLSPDDVHPHLILLEIHSEQALAAVCARLERHGLQFSPFYEPDLGDELTAVATEVVRGEKRKLMRRYQCLKSVQATNSITHLTKAST